jgi:hypothetical protein
VVFPAPPGLLDVTTKYLVSNAKFVGSVPVVVKTSSSPTCGDVAANATVVDPLVNVGVPVAVAALASHKTFCPALATYRADWVAVFVSDEPPPLGVAIHDSTPAESVCRTCVPVGEAVGNVRA